jgi:hypothetical protein
MPEKAPEDFSRSATIRERENLLHIFRKLIEHVFATASFGGGQESHPKMNFSRTIGIF